MTDAALPQIHGFSLRRIALYLLLAGSLLYYMTLSAQLTFWPCMTFSYCLGAAVYYWEKRRNLIMEYKSLAGYLFPKKVWLSTSSINDGIIGLIFYFVFIQPSDYFHPFRWATYIVNHLFPEQMQAKLQLAQHTVYDVYGMPHVVMVQTPPDPGLTAIIVYIVSVLVVVDFVYYFAHRWTHTVPMLWEFHKIHHSATVMTPLTIQRFHPLDAWFTYLLRIAGFTLSNCVFLYLYPGLKAVYIVGAVDIGIVMADLAAANLRHSHIWLRFGTFLEHILVSPATHQIHHSIERKHLNKNFGSVFNVWDWMFGSLYIPQGREYITFGLGSDAANAPYATITGMLFHPFKQFFKKSKA